MAQEAFQMIRSRRCKAQFDVSIYHSVRSSLGLPTGTAISTRISLGGIGLRPRVWQRGNANGVCGIAMPKAGSGSESRFVTKYIYEDVPLALWMIIVMRMDNEPNAYEVVGLT